MINYGQYTSSSPSSCPQNWNILGWFPQSADCDGKRLRDEWERFEKSIASDSDVARMSLQTHSSKAYTPIFFCYYVTFLNRWRSCTSGGTNGFLQNKEITQPPIYMPFGIPVHSTDTGCITDYTQLCFIYLCKAWFIATAWSIFYDYDSRFVTRITVVNKPSELAGFWVTDVPCTGEEDADFKYPILYLYRYSDSLCWVKRAVNLGWIRH